MLYDLFVYNNPTKNFNSLSKKEQTKIVNEYKQAAQQGLKELNPNPLNNTIVHEIVHLHSDHLFQIVFNYGCPFLNTPNAEGNTPLLDAILANDENLIIELLKGNITESINYPNKARITPLFAAVNGGNPRLVELLLIHGAKASVNKPDKRNMTPLHIAATLEDSTILEMLLKYEAKESIMIKDNWELTPFERAIISERTSAVKLMLEAKPELKNEILNKTEEHPISPLQRAARSGNKEMWDLLSENQNITVEADLEACLVQGSVDFKKIPLDQIDFPLLIAQNSCHVMLRLKNGDIFKIPHADAKQVRKELLEMKNEKEGLIHDNGLNALTLYLNSGHGFLRLKCMNCNEGKSYNKNAGFYPSPEMNAIKQYVEVSAPFIASAELGTNSGLGMKSAIIYIGMRGSIGNEDISERVSDVVNSPKVTFYINDVQAMAALKAIKKVEASCKEEPYTSCTYSIIGRNCIDFIETIYESSSGQGDFADYFTDSQLSEGQTGNYAFFRSQGKKAFNYLKSNPTITEISNLLGPTLGSTTVKHLALKDIQHINLRPAFPQIANPNISNDFNPLYQPHLLEGIMLGAVLAKTAANAYSFATDLWGKVIGEKVSGEGYEEWMEAQQFLLALSLETLDDLADQIDEGIDEIDVKINEIKKQMLPYNMSVETGLLYDKKEKLELEGLKLELEGLNKDRSLLRKLKHLSIDLQFEAMELEEELNGLKSTGLPTKTHAASLETKIANLADKVTDIENHSTKD